MKIMDNNNDAIQNLSAEQSKIRQKLIENLSELYFLRNNGQICDFHVWSLRERFGDRFSQIDDEDLINDQKFSQLLNLKLHPHETNKHPLNDSISQPHEKKTRYETSKEHLARGKEHVSCDTLADSETIPKPVTEPDISENQNDSNSAQHGKSGQPLSNDSPEDHDPMEVDITIVTPKSQDELPKESNRRTSHVEGTPPSGKSRKEQRIDETTSKETTNNFSEPACSIIDSTPVIISNKRSSSEEITSEKIKIPRTQSFSSPSKEDSPTRISKAVETIVTPAAVIAENNHRQQQDRVQHESAVQSRISELRKLGLWTAKRLPKLQEPPRPKTHWDCLLDEARWLHNDYRMERKWKRDAARRVAYAAYRYINNKRTQEERIIKEKIQYIKKIAATLSKEVRSFWGSIEKIVDFRQQTKLEETRKKAYGLHLNYILDQTSKFSNTFVEEQPQTQQLSNNQNEISYLINKEGDGDTDKKGTVINNDEQTKYNQKVDDMAAGAESIQPKGNTFETTTVNTKVPFLLKHTLREYQHIGLDWLVAMYKKQLNGILADEMGLGKTIQTIALLAYLACEEQEWGPHLIVVPTSVMLNWEMEFKKWCPAFKILTYYGTPKERKLKRVGWSRPNSFHVCITSYRIVIQDHAAFRRKQWCYFILDEAHYIKNFKSQRWQMLLNFNSQRRLLLTGTPLQNDLMELWSLMHFLMPSLFDSLNEFKDWFVNPLTGMIEGSHEYNQELVQRFHKVLRPFLLRRLKIDVEKQLPKKREIIKYCRLSKRQRFLYEEFMSLSKTKETLASGNFLSVINVLMQLRKVCNHPNLFEPRPTISPFKMSSIMYKVPGIVTTPLDYDPNISVNLNSLQLSLVDNSLALTTTARDYIKLKKVPRVSLVEEIPDDKRSDSSSVTQDMEVDETAYALESDRVLDAYSIIKEKLRHDREQRLQFLADINDMRCDKIHSTFFSDIEDVFDFNNLEKMVTKDDYNVFSNGNGRIICSLANQIKSSPKYKLNLLTNLLDSLVKSPEQLVEEMSSIIDRYIFCVQGVSVTPISLHVTHRRPSKKIELHAVQKALYNELSPKFDFLNRIMVNMRTTFPELRLIEYDCGKLQALGQLLIELKSHDHRVLIFTQMSRMLDILEQFLNYHGHTYLRLDGATRIDQRQILMERFNNDKRIFCFILSTRSGGLGVNLTGADTVIFYDSDWNPTMDAQAQDRCHRIGQTRDVCIYRLISEDTIEQNIYRKAQQKRMLGDLAIEEGNFGNSCFKKNTIQELFERNKEPVDVDSVVEVDNRHEEVSKAQLLKLEQALSKCEADAGEDMDVDAIKVARADNDTDLKEFDENIPLTEEGSPVEKSEKEQQIDEIVAQMTPVEQYAVKFLESLHHDNFKEELEQAEKEYIQELENKKSQWEQSRIDLLKEQAVINEAREEDAKSMLTYPKDAKCEHVHFMLDGTRKVEDMPLWTPPTPPTSPPSPVEEDNQYRYQPSMTPAMAARINAMGGLSSIFGFGSEFNKADSRYYIHEKDIYIDHTSDFLYDPNVMPESQLPPVNQSYTENEITSYTIGSKKIRLTGTPVVPIGYYPSPTQGSHLQSHLQNISNVTTTPDGNAVVVAGQQSARKPKVRRDEVICLPRSLFDRPQGNQVKARRDLKLQKLRCVTRGNDSDPFAMQKFFHSFSFNPLGQSIPQETVVHHVQRQIHQYPNAILSYHQDQLPPWTIQEEWAILMVIQHLQDLPVNLNVLTPGHTPNWELVSEVVSDIGFAHRSFKMCEYHYAREVQKREMTRDSSWDERALHSSQTPEGTQPPTKKSKKHKNQSASTDGQSSQQANANKAATQAQLAPFKPSKTGDMLAHDRSLQLFFSERYGIIHKLRQSRPKTIRSRFSSSHERSNGTFVTLVRDDKRLIDYNNPLKPETIILELTEERIRRAPVARQAGHTIAHRIGPMSR